MEICLRIVPPSSLIVGPAETLYLLKASKRDYKRATELFLAAVLMEQYIGERVNWGLGLL